MPKKAYRNRPKQTTLTFGTLSSSSPARDGYSQAVHDRLASVRYTGPSRSSPSNMSGPSDARPALPTPEPSSQPDIHHRQQKNSHVVSSSDDSDEDELVLPSQKRRRISYAPLSAPTTSPTPHRSTRSSSRPTAQISLDSDDQETDITPASSTRRSTRLRPREPTYSPIHENLHPASTHALSKSSLDFASAETSDEDDVVLTSRPAATRRRTKSIPQTDPFIVNDDEVTYISDDTEPTQRRRNRPNRSTDNFIASDDEIDPVSSSADDGIERSPHRPRRLIATGQKKTKARRARTRKEQDELDDDLENLQDSDDNDSPTMSRTRGGPVTTKRDGAKEHFELLRRRRAGEKIPRIWDSEDESDTISNISEAVNIDLIGEPDPQAELSDQSFHEAPELDYPVEDDDNDVDDFIIDDSQDNRGRPLRDIPLQFTSYASAKPKELFFYIIEWLVKNKIAPAFSRQDELYNLAFDRVEDQVKAQAGSRLISSAWGAEFKRVIMARPEMKVALLPGFDEEHIRDCDACNRTNHPARYEFIFSGQPYFKKTLEPVDDSDEEENEDASDQDHDEHGYALPSSSQRYYLGRTCAANARMGHKLTHWKHHLNESLLAYLEEQGVLSAEALVAREKINKKKREKQAEHIVETMDNTGMIDELWSAFKGNLEDARLGMEA